MKASELIMRLEAMVHHNGDLEVAVTDDHGDIMTLKTQVEVVAVPAGEQFPLGPWHVLMLEAEEF